jgi:phosphoribosylformylglycinamidine synthase
VKIGVVTFPGSLDEVDAQRAVTLGGHTAVPLWHGDADLHGVDAVVLPGGFSYGDYLRCGAIARFAPVMGPLVEAADTTWTRQYSAGEEIVVPLKNGEGGFVADERTLDALEGEGRVVARYLDVNPNGSLRDIAGISNERGNVVGLMPHPEHAVEEGFGPGTDGLGFFTWALERAAS